MDFAIHGLAGRCSYFFLCVYILILNLQAIIDGDLQKLVHLSNGSHMVECAGPLQVGGVCRAETLIASVTNTVADKAVRVKGHVYCGNRPVIEVVPYFLHRGRFTDYENTFQNIEEPGYLVQLPDDAAVDVLQSKEWFEFRLSWHSAYFPGCLGIWRHFRPRSTQLLELSPSLNRGRRRLFKLTPRDPANSRGVV
jgi:hypothetical protein